MRLIPSDPDVATLLARIKNHDIDLQPDFQRGEVWGYPKKQKLIDSILREWHVPPIHVIETKDSGRQEVLDGQQRLAAIRDFANGKVKIDGKTEPLNQDILTLDGMTYADLPGNFRRRFDQFTIRLFRIIDYKAAEPGELFFRLNQPVGLTTAEQRNAFFGGTRHQIRDAVSFMADCGVNKDVIGFSNGRMAYDDVIARVAMTLDDGTLAKKIDAGRLANQYRSETLFSEQSLKKIKEAIVTLSSLPKERRLRVKFNKATLYSWLLFIVRTQKEFGSKFDGQVFSSFLNQFEMLYFGVNAVEGQNDNWSRAMNDVLRVYEDRSTSRVGDVSSVIMRDLIICLAYIWLSFSPKPDFKPNGRMYKLNQAISKRPFKLAEGSFYCEQWLSDIAQDAGWGEI